MRNIERCFLLTYSSLSEKAFFIFLFSASNQWSLLFHMFEIIHVGRRAFDELLNVSTMINILPHKPPATHNHFYTRRRCPSIFRIYHYY